MNDSHRPPRRPPARSGGSQAAPGPRGGTEQAQLSNDVLRDLEAASRPGKAEVAAKVFGEAVTLYMNGRSEEAVRQGERAKQLALRSSHVREFLGLAYYRMERWREAARELAAFRRMTGSTAQNHVIADCYRALGRPDKALGYCDEIDAERVPEAVLFEGEIVAAGALADQGRFEEGLGRLLRLDLKPATVREHHLRAWYVLGDLLERAGRFSQARKWFGLVAEADPDLTDAAERSEKLA